MPMPSTILSASGLRSGRFSVFQSGVAGLIYYFLAVVPATVLLPALPCFSPRLLMPVMYKSLGP